MYAECMSVEDVLAETRALSLCLNVIRGKGDMEEAVTDVWVFLRKTGQPSDVSEMVIQSAMNVITGVPVREPSFTPADKPVDRHVFETISKGWIQWASQKGSSTALDAIQTLEVPLSGPRALHMMALRPWKEAVEALLLKDLVNARRLFWRASELGSQFGTESNPSVQWTFAASFFFSPTILF